MNLSSHKSPNLKRLKFVSRKLSAPPKPTSLVFTRDPARSCWWSGSTTRMELATKENHRDHGNLAPSVQIQCLSFKIRCDGQQHTRGHI
ncbi:hypothetical protein TIFTF001_046994 [Ficus carica]|uniref:Uncharacterized protein n=1 Tax=Ficus carica TaxID=3494 RepID=A0AA88CKJ9_FICCA|nr:hypothetical protein TIFTF001_046994 [Ficus carica]